VSNPPNEYYSFFIEFSFLKKIGVLEESNNEEKTKKFSRSTHIVKD